MRAGRAWIKTGAALLLTAVAWGAGAASPPLEEEIVNPSEVVFEGGQAYADAGDGTLERLRSRQRGGETIYYRLVRYDNEFGYVTDDGTPTVAHASSAEAADAVTPFRYYGSGNLYRPDFYNSPYNRDARQRYWGPGYFGSCSRYDGCKEVQYVPLLPYYRHGY